MTEEEFELKLRERIKNVLETEHEDYAQEHWENFEKKLSHSQNRKRLATYLRIAASILLFAVCGISLIFVYNEYYTSTNQIALRDNSLQHQKEEKSIHKEEVDSKVLVKTNTRNRVVETKGAGETNIGNNLLPSNSEMTNLSKSNSENIIPSQKNSQTKYETELEKVTIANNTTVNIQANSGKTDTLLTLEQKDKFVKQNLPVNSRELENPYLFANSTKSFLRLGANVSSIVNYDQADNSSKLHLGGGIFVEIPLFEDLVVYSGVQLTNQTINFQNVTEQSIALGKHGKSKDLQLMGFDIPINLKYRFGFANTRLFVSTGISSLTFLKENIETTYDVRSTVSTVFGNGITIMQTVSKEEVETNSLGPFNDFFFAKILNVSFGLEIPLNSKNILLVEPYLKYSVGPLKSVEAYPSIFGINLGIMF